MTQPLKYYIDPRRRKQLFWLFLFVFWYAYLLEDIVRSPEEFKDFKTVLFELLGDSIPIIFSLLLGSVYSRYRCYTFTPGVLVVIILLYSIFCAMIWSYGIILLGNLFFGEQSYPLHFFTPKSLFTTTWFRAHPFVIWSAFFLGFKVYEEWIFQKQSAERAQMLAQSAQLEALRYQLNPHFLFNTLSSLRGLIAKDQELAKDVVLKISEFLRYTLSPAKNNEVPLSQELQALWQYLDIEKIRYGDNLVVRFDIDPLAEDYPIPIFLLHPLVENAVKHGMKTTQLPLRLTLSAQIEDSNLRIELVNTGKWLEREPSTSGLGTKTGLENVRKRLQHFYPRNHRFEIQQGEEAVHITITITRQLVPSHVA